MNIYVKYSLNARRACDLFVFLAATFVPLPRSPVDQSKRSKACAFLNSMIMSALSWTVGASLAHDAVSPKS